MVTIAAKFGLSQRTVSNHLKSSFWKLGVHSQAELIELARSDPRRLGLEHEEMGASGQLDLTELENRCELGRNRMVARIEEAYVGPPAVSQLRAAIHAALPLDVERRRDWRDWLELRARLDAQGGTMGDPQKGIEDWRDSNVNRVRLLQETGLLREDLDAEELLAAIGALVLGAAARLLGNASEASSAKEVRMLDAFVDSLETSNQN